MKRNIFAVCDLEAAYAYNLMEYMNIRQCTPFDVQAFTNVKSLELFVKEHPIELLLISANAMCEEVKEMRIGKIMILSEGEMLEELCDYPYIYKYQSSDHLITEVMGYYAKQEEAQEPLPQLKKKVEIIGIYSPVKRTLKTSFALTLGQLLAKNHTVLYINFEEYSGFEALMGKKFSEDLIDLMYFIRQGSRNILYKMSGMVHTIQNLDYIPPAYSPMDLRGVSYEEWTRLLDEIITFSSYQVVILDLGEQVDEIFKLLKRCKKIYMPIKEDAMSLAKLEQFEHLLEIWECEELKDRIKKIKLPFHGSFGSLKTYVEQLIWGELGDFTRKLIEEEKQSDRGG